jgi:GT2 family glycosyltransferase
MKLSIIILCWNDRHVIADCLRSIHVNTHSTEFEIIVSDNGSTDGSIGFIRSSYPMVRVIENGRNLRFAKANNVGIRACQGEYILILNPDTIIHDCALDRMTSFADQHSEAGAFGCRVLNSDGSYQVSARPFASFRSEWIAALYLRGLGRLHKWFTSGSYPGWRGTSERQVGWVSGCFILARGSLLKSIGGFDEQFFLLLRGYGSLPPYLASRLSNSVHARCDDHTSRRTIDESSPSCAGLRVRQPSDSLFVLLQVFRKAWSASGTAHRPWSPPYSGGWALE